MSREVYGDTDEDTWTWRCDPCGMDFETEREYEQHMDEDHPDEGGAA